jgi:FAD/FMN-containing dehydrogenase
MPVDTLMNTNGSPVDDTRLEQFRAAFRGDIVRPTDATYEGARQIWNAGALKRPGAIARCTGVADVVAAVNFARANDVRVAIRGGGHNVGGRALCDDGLVIDLSRMRSVHADPASRTVRVQGGARLGDLDRETHLFGLAVPAGIVSRTGIGGLTLGGGVGWLIRKHGLSVDNLISCQVVTADGNVLTASATENEDLFWALRGGGGNFGVVTSFEFRAHPVGTVLGGLLVYPRLAARDVLRNFRDFMLSAPDELTAYAALLHTPDGAPVVGVIPCYCGDLDEGQRVLRPLRSFGSPVMDAVQPLPFPAMQSILDPSFPDGHHNYWKSSMQRELSDAAIDVIVDRADEMPSPLSAVVAEYYGGAAGRVSDAATAFPHRQAVWDIVVIAQWTDAAETERNRTWARGTAAALQAYSTGGHLLGVLDQDDASGSAFGSNLGRLIAIKMKYDPANFFRVNQNIRPDAEAVATA